MADGNYYLILAEILKQQISISPVTPLFNLKSKIQLNNIGSTFEASNGIYTCVHPLTEKLSEDFSVGMFTVQTDRADIEYYKESSEDIVRAYMARRKPMFVKYGFNGWEEKTCATLILYITDKTPEIPIDLIPGLMNELFGTGVTTVIDVGELDTKDSSKEILETYVKDLKFEELSNLPNGEKMYSAVIQETPFLKRAFVSEDKGTICIFREHFVRHKTKLNLDEDAGTRFDFVNRVQNLMESGVEFDSLIVEAYDELESETEDNYIIYTFCVNVNALNKKTVVTMLESLLGHFDIYKYNRVVPKRLTYLDIL